MLSAIGFLTVLGAARSPDHRTLWFFPLVGAGVGGLLALVQLGAGAVWAPGVVATLVVLADLAVTGLLHVDGLADSTDGLLPHLPADRRLAVMATPDVGAFALAVVPAVLLARWSALATDRIDPLAVVGVWAMARTVAAGVPALVPYARQEGLATAFLSGGHAGVLVALVPVGALLVMASGVAGAAALAAGVATAGGVVMLARRRIGGFTGDVLGAAIVLAETAALLALAATP